MNDRIIYFRRNGSSLAAMIFLLAASAFADIPAPGNPKSEPQGTDWGFILMGAVSGFLGAILFLWIGRKLFKRS